MFLFLLAFINMEATEPVDARVKFVGVFANMAAARVKREKLATEQEELEENLVDLLEKTQKLHKESYVSAAPFRERLKKELSERTDIRAAYYLHELKRATAAVEVLDVSDGTNHLLAIAAVKPYLSAEERLDGLIGVIVSYLSVKGSGEEAKAKVQ